MPIKTSILMSPALCFLYFRRHAVIHIDRCFVACHRLIHKAITKRRYGIENICITYFRTFSTLSFWINLNIYS